MRLRELRLSRGLTQAELAREMIQSRSNISKYENGQIEPDIRTIIAIASYFDVTTDYLLEVTDSKHSPMT